MLDKEGNISTKTFQKKMDLFLYIPPHSSHPPGLMKSLIYGLLLTYFLQNTHRSDFFDMISLLHKRLLARGHRTAMIQWLIQRKVLTDQILHVLTKYYSFISHFILKIFQDRKSVISTKRHVKESRKVATLNKCLTKIVAIV